MTKRVAAIVGPTPPFICWAVDFPCPLQRGLTRRSPEMVWRQLRPIKELSRAVDENRVHAGVCFPRTQPNVKGVFGFVISEAAAAFGGWDWITQTCRSCPANSPTFSDELAGCCGAVALVPLANSVDEMSTNWTDWLDEVEVTLCQPKLADMATRLKTTTRPSWFGLWMGSSLNHERLLFAGECLGNIPDRLLADPENWRSFCFAIGECYRRGLAMFVQSIPPGISDGVHWTIPPHCRHCGWERPNAAPGACPCCGAVRSYVSGWKRKAMGLRPFLDLGGVLGDRAADELYREYCRGRALL